MLLPSLAQRRREPELMDQPGLGISLHEQALRGLSRVNWLSRSATLLWQPIHSLAREIGHRPLRVLDVACGGGDTAIRLAHMAQQRGVSIEMTGCDVSPTALDFARRAANAANVPVDFFETDVLHAALPTGYDVICSSLFLHHLDHDAAIHVLSSMRQAAGHMVLINDLKRSLLGYLLAYVGIRVLTRSHICHVDGPLSVQGAFTPHEATDLARQAGMDQVTVSSHWPERFLLTWRRSS